MDGDVLIPFVFFGFLAAIILVPIYLKERTKQSAHQLISQALEKGQQLDPALMRQITEGSAKPPQDRARRTLGSGVVLLALAMGFGVAGYVIGHNWRGGSLWRHDGAGHHPGRPGHRLHPARHHRLCR